MPKGRLSRYGFRGVVVAILLTPFAGAQADGPNSDLAINPDDEVSVAYAVYGGIENAQTHYVDVTKKVADLFKGPSAGFPVTEEEILGVKGSKPFQSLVVFYNYNGKSHVFSMPEDGGDVTLAKLKQEARIHISHDLAVPPPGTPDNDFRVAFAAYGVSDGGPEQFWNVTALVRSLVRDQSDGFFAHENVMGGDPHPGDQKAIIIVFDNETGRHFYTQVNNGPLINKEVLLDAASSN